jgi:hypothetical protein
VNFDQSLMNEKDESGASVVVGVAHERDDTEE